MWKEFKEFAVKGSALDLAIGVIIGAAFGTVVNSIVNDLVNPVLGLVVGKVNFDRIVIGLPGDGVIRVGTFINTVINFLVVAFAIFLIVKQLNRFKRAPQPAEPNEKDCPFCLSRIPIKAVRCPQCTSQRQN